MVVVLLIGGFLVMVAAFWLLHRQYRHSVSYLEKHFREKVLQEQTAQTLRMNEKMARQASERSLQMKRQMLSNIFQELNIPLVDILGCTEEMNFKSDHTIAQVARMKNDAQRMKFIIDKMVELTRYELMREVPMNDHVAINHVCRQLIDHYQNYTPAGVKLSLETTLDDDLMIFTNEECLTKTLCHLLDASLRHTDAGSITLCVTNRGLRGYVSFTVNDTGLGIPKQYRKTVFDVLPDEGWELKSTGMSLMICRSLVRLLDGTIYVDPHIDNGTCVVFNIKE